MKSKSFADKLNIALKESRLYPIFENRGGNAAIIYMKRGTIIPVHHHRVVVSPTTGEQIVVAGISPGRYRMVVTGGYSIKRHWFHRLRDFWAPGMWIPCVRAVRGGWQDETGWSEPEEEGGPYDASRDYELVRKFKKILTIRAKNIKEIKPLPPGTDASQFEPGPYDDEASLFRRNRVRGDRLD